MDAKTMQEKIDLREKLIADMRALNDSVKNEKGEVREMTAEESEKFAKMNEEVLRLHAEITEERRAQTLAGFSTFAPNADEGKKEKTDEMRNFEAYLKGEKRDLVIDGASNTAGALAPTMFVEEIIKDLFKDTSLLGRVRQFTLNRAQDIEAPVETEMADAAWTGETSEITADTTQSFKTKKIGCNRLGKLVKVSKKTILASAFDIPSLLSEELTYKLRCALVNGILNGRGSANNEPLGVFTASADGVSTAQDITTAGATITADEIIKTKRKVSGGYRANGIWVIHPDIVTDLLTLKDNNGQYIWRSGLLPGDPDMLDGSPIFESEFAPGTKAAGTYAALFGNFDQYWMTMLNQISVQTLLEKYAEFGLVGYLSEVFAGGSPVSEKAFARLKYKA